MGGLYTIVDRVHLVYILKKRIIEIEMIKLMEIDLGNIGMQKIDIIHPQVSFGAFGVMNQFMALLYTEVKRIRIKMCRC